MTEVYGKDDDEEQESPAQELKEVSLVPTLEEDEMETEVDTNDLETSVLKSPVTPEPNMLVNEDSMGFDNLQALNIVTPGIDSTQAFMSLLSKNLSPIKRKCHRTDPEPEPLDSTQTYFNLTKHYKLLSEERKKVLYGEPVNGGSASCKSAAKPLRRKLFDQEDELDVGINADIKTVEDEYDDCKLESFEEEWKKVSILKPDRQEDILKTEETIGKEAAATVEEVTVVTSEVTCNVADSFQTPVNRVSKVSILTPQTEPDVSVPAMVIEETVCTVGDSASDEVLKSTEQPDVIMADPSHDKNGSESLKLNCNDVSSVPESRDHIQVSFDTKCQISPASNGKTTADQSEGSENVIANEVVVHNTESSDSESEKCEPSSNFRSNLTTHLKSDVPNRQDMLGLV